MKIFGANMDGQRGDMGGRECTPTMYGEMLLPH